MTEKKGQRVFKYFSRRYLLMDKDWERIGELSQDKVLVVSAKDLNKLQVNGLNWDHIIIDEDLYD